MRFSVEGTQVRIVSSLYYTMSTSSVASDSSDEQRKLQLEIQKLRPDIDQMRCTAKFDVALRLLSNVTVIVAVLGFGFMAPETSLLFTITSGPH